jgi:ABC-type dipeptide/oligopeptide/nickel transport system permease subunit
MSLLALVLILIVIGVLLGLLNRYGAEYIDAKFVKLINIVVIIAVVLWLLTVVGLLPMASTVQVPRVR